MSDHWTMPEQASEYGKALLAGERVRLRPATEADLPILAAWYTDPEYTVLQSTTYQITSPNDTAEKMKKWFSNEDVVGGANFAIEATTSGELVGGVNMFGGGLPHRTATVAIQVGGDVVGRGYGSEALRLAVGFGFRELGLNRIQLSVFAFNSRAIRAYEKAGFVVEGRRRQAAFHDGRFIDELVMAILADDWRLANSAATA